VTTIIHHVVTFDASPQRVYEALVDEANFASFSGAPAEIDSTPGGSFSLFGATSSAQRGAPSWKTRCSGLAGHDLGARSLLGRAL
jgi:uncharacterized protein YndB with AHSA1/START domain